jgi:hypothetical protein
MDADAGDSDTQSALLDRLVGQLSGTNAHTGTVESNTDDALGSTFGAATDGQVQ